MQLRDDLPANLDLRRDIYRGEVFLRPATPASLELVDDVRRQLEDSFATSEVRRAPALVGEDTFFTKIGELRRRLFTTPHYVELVRNVLAAQNFDPSRVAFDPLRLRVIMDRGHENPRARPVYYPHRDTWYGHPSGIITWWIPLDNLQSHETFVFYPEDFASEVANDSEIFDYDEWVAKGWDLKIGWQDPEAGRTARYPQAYAERSPSSGIGFSAERGQNLLFSGAHFHQTLPQSTGLARYSLDFRVVVLDDHAASLGAPNVDNRSRGSALRDYTQPHD